MKKPKVIYYVGGCYGTFVEWSCNYFERDNPIKFLPFTSNGSSHNYHGHFLPYSVMFNEYINSDKLFPYCRTHPGISTTGTSMAPTQNQTYYELYCADLDLLLKNFDQILVLYPTINTRLWIDNNSTYKCRITVNEYHDHFEKYKLPFELFEHGTLTDFDDKIKHILSKELDISNIQQWGKQSVYELERWEIRELLSFYWHNRIRDSYSCWNSIVQQFSKDNIKFISVEQFKDNFSCTVTEYLDFFNVNKIENFNQELELVAQQWKDNQVHINQDQIVDAIITSTLTDTYYQWDKLTIINEAHIQKTLRDYQYEIQCDGLNTFPTNTDELQKILYRI